MDGWDMFYSHLPPLPVPGLPINPSAQHPCLGLLTAGEMEGTWVSQLVAVSPSSSPAVPWWGRAHPSAVVVSWRDLGLLALLQGCGNRTGSPQSPMGTIPAHRLPAEPDTGRGLLGQARACCWAPLP